MELRSWHLGALSLAPTAFLWSLFGLLVLAAPAAGQPGAAGPSVEAHLLVLTLLLVPAAGSVALLLREPTRFAGAVASFAVAGIVLTAAFLVPLNLGWGAVLALTLLAGGLLAAGLSALTREAAPVPRDVGPLPFLAADEGDVEERP